MVGSLSEAVLKARLFLTEVSQEARRVTWPSPREVAGATAVVLVTTVAVALVLLAYDIVISAGLGLLFPGSGGAR